MKIIKEKREELNLTQKQLAEKIGVTKGVISHFETGRKTPRVENAKKLGEVLGIEWYLLYE